MQRISLLTIMSSKQRSLPPMHCSKSPHGRCLRPQECSHSGAERPGFERISFCLRKEAPRYIKRAAHGECHTAKKNWLSPQARYANPLRVKGVGRHLLQQAVSPSTSPAPDRTSSSFRASTSDKTFRASGSAGSRLRLLAPYSMCLAMLHKMFAVV